MANDDKRELQEFKLQFAEQQQRWEQQQRAQEQRWDQRWEEQGQEMAALKRTLYVMTKVADVYAVVTTCLAAYLKTTLPGKDTVSLVMLGLPAMYFVARLAGPRVVAAFARGSRVAPANARAV